MTLQVGVIGAGLMGTTHVRVLATAVPTADVVAISDAVAERGEQLAREAGVDRVTTDALELIHDPAVEAVVIASTADTHEPFVLACFEAGKPVLCEKPLAATPAAARRVLEAEAALGRRLVQVGFMRRFDPAYAALKRELDEGRLGGPLLLHCAHRNASVPPTYTSDMLVTSSLTHEIDVIRWLTGEEIATVTLRAPRSSSRANGLRDPQLAILETEGGVLVDVEVFANAGYGYDIRCEVVGEDGTLALPLSVASGFEERFEDAYRHELLAWVRALADGTEAPGATAADGYAAAAVCEAGVRSLQEGRSIPVAC